MSYRLLQYFRGSLHFGKKMEVFSSGWSKITFIYFFYLSTDLKNMPKPQNTNNPKHTILPSDTQTWVCSSLSQASPAHCWKYSSLLLHCYFSCSLKAKALWKEMHYPHLKYYSEKWFTGLSSDPSCSLFWSLKSQPLPDPSLNAFSCPSTWRFLHLLSTLSFLPLLNFWAVIFPRKPQ